MPRKPRLHIPGGIYHVILRGDNRQPLFFSASDRLDFESLVEGGVARYACQVCVVLDDQSCSSGQIVYLYGWESIQI